MYTYERYNFRIFTLLLALMTFIFLVYSEFIGASVSLLVGILISFSYRGTLIDEKKLRYMKYDRFLWVKIGRWESMSVPSYVTVVRINLSSRRTITVSPCTSRKQEGSQILQSKPGRGGR